MTELIYKGLATLPEKQRQRIYAHFFLGMSYSAMPEPKAAMNLLFVEAFTGD